MMPGETRSATPGAAVELSRCQGCASLQQNLNEYVDALIILKQKIINTDNLLTEYQKKCDELQFARRENSTLHHQVEQMLQKISPLQKCQEELGSLKAELEEKKVHRALLLQGCVWPLRMKKKLEAKVKKLEEAAFKQIQDFKQLRNEKKVLEKEYKQTQEKLDEFSKQKHDKELRHIGTQISSDSHGNIDKRKVKLLLKELWLCINATQGLPGADHLPAAATPENSEEPEGQTAESLLTDRCREPVEAGGLSPLQYGPPGTPDTQMGPASTPALDIRGDFSAYEDSVGKEWPGQAGSWKKPSPPEASLPWPSDEDQSVDFAHHDPSFDEDLQAAINFFKLPPPLLSPVPSPPPVPSPHAGLSPARAPGADFGAYSDSSEEGSGQRRHLAGSTAEDDATEPQNYFMRSEGSCTLLEPPAPQEVLPAPISSEENGLAGLPQLPAVAAEPLRREAATSPRAPQRGAAGWQAEASELEKAVQTEDADKAVQTEDMALGSPRRPVWPRSPPLSQRPLRDLLESGKKTLLSELTRRALGSEMASESDRVRAISELFHRVSCELEKGAEGRQGLGCRGTPESDEGSGHVAGLDVDMDMDMSISPSSPSGALSLCSAPQSSDDEDMPVPPTRALPEEPCATQRMALSGSSLGSLQPEIPPQCSVGGSELDSSGHTLSPKMGAARLHNPSGRLREGTNVVREIRSLLQPTCLKAARDRPCEHKVAGSECPIHMLAPSRAAAAHNPSWHHSDFLKRTVEGSLKAALDCGQEATSSLETRGSTPTPEPPPDTSRPGQVRPASLLLLPNQVSVITTQARLENIPSAASGHLQLQGREAPPAAESPRASPDSLAPAPAPTPAPALVPAPPPASAPMPVPWNDGREPPKSQEAASTPIASPGGSTPQPRFNSDSDSSILLGENSPCSISSRLSFSLENLPALSPDQEELQKQRQSPLEPLNPEVPGMATSPTSSSELPCGDLGCSSSQAPAASGGIPGPAQGRDGSPRPGSSAPTAVFSEDLACAGHTAALVQEEEEARALSQHRPLEPPCCYTGLRERAVEDTEGEGLSCSEGESEAGALLGAGKPGMAGAAPAEAAGAPVPASQPCVEVGHLTSALQEVNISALSDIDQLSTSEVVRFLESCQLRDYSSGDSFSECSSKGVLNLEGAKELREGEVLGEQSSPPPGGEEGPAEPPSSEEEGLPMCASDTLSEVLTSILPELHGQYGDAAAHASVEALTPDTSQAMAAPQEGVAPAQPATVPLQKPAASLQEVGAALPQEAVPPPQEAVLPPQEESAAPLQEEAAASTQEEMAAPPEEEVAVAPPKEEAAALPHEAAHSPSHLVELPPLASLGPPSSPLASGGSDGEGGLDAPGDSLLSAVTSEVISVLINTGHNLVIGSGDQWTVINSVAVLSGLDQVLLCDTSGDPTISPDQEGLEAGFLTISPVEKDPEGLGTGSPAKEPGCSSPQPCSQEVAASTGPGANFDKSRLRLRPVRPSVRINAQIYSPDFESQAVASDHTYYNTRLEPSGRNKNRSKVPIKDQPAKAVKASVPSRADGALSDTAPLSLSGEVVSSKPQKNPAQAVIANADTSTPPEGSALPEAASDALSKIRQEVGPPLPPLLAPLIATPPRTSQPVSPPQSSCSPSSPASPMASPLSGAARPTPPTLACLSPCTAEAGERGVHSPLQFCAATPKHALPVPGRLPPMAPSPTTLGGAQESSVKMLDTMYPELSARARTLHILKGGLQLSGGPSAEASTLCGPLAAAASFKAITSESTAFVKPGGGAATDCSQEQSKTSGTPQDAGAKRTLSLVTLRSAKRLRLDIGPLTSETRGAGTEGVGRSLRRTIPPTQAMPANGEGSCFVAAAVLAAPQSRSNPRETVESHDKTIANALRKLEEASFDLLPVIRSHVYVGNISKKPVMRDQEKEVVYEFSTAKKHLAECFLHSILSELHLQKSSAQHCYLHALCRVYVGICRQLGDLERARMFCYSILKEDFPESDKLTLFIANMWRDIFISQSVINKAMQLVARQRAKGEVLNCLRAFLNWEKNAPVDVGFMVSKLLLTIQLCPNTEFHSSERFGEDLSENTWECIFAIDLLCCHQKWVWTHDNIISKELWPVMDKWIKYRKGHANTTHTPDVIVASVLRLIGRLGQLGLKEGFPSAVRNISSVIGMFIQHAQDEDIPWGVQLAAVYALCDLSPSNPAGISQILDTWQKDSSQSVPTAVVAYLEEAGALCEEEQEEGHG
ncbi:little elongation complex subunit 1 [Echinops telfairi]|uniref:Little elongation complex subunit 1 n=1 Tax=Echinops telfairi TaxID=9371 RepID=A0AC55CL39_ECHTE|nr:little elongation complex subunit 1 [Echinops telfairi]